MSPTPDVDLRDLRIEDRAGTGGRRWILLVLLILLPIAFGAGWWLRGGRGSGLSGGGASTSVRIEAVRLGADRNTADLGEGGWIEVPSYHPIIVSALVPGRVEELLVLEGSRVSAGDVIARLWSKDFEDRRDEARAVENEAKAKLDLLLAGYRVEDVEKARADVRRLSEEVRLTERVAARTRSLVPEGAASAEDLERDDAAFQVARNRLAAADQERLRLEAGFRTEEIQSARAALERAKAARSLAASGLAYCEVKSPVEGVVLERFVTPGTSITAGDPRIVSLYDPKDLQARVDVRQESAGRVRVGQQVEIMTDAEPDVTYHGVVIRVDPLADFKKNTIQAKVRIEDPGPGLHPEMICRARFLAGDDEADPEKTRRLTIPAGAVVSEDGRTFVYLVRDGRARRVEVRLGESAAGRVVVESGLARGDRVVVDPPPSLADGAPVEENSR